MFGFRYIKALPHVYLLQYSKGKVVREGTGLSFFYFAPTTSLVSLPIASSDLPFIFNEVTGDFQEITIQGQVTWRITDPTKTAAMLDFTLDSTGQQYISDDPEKLAKRVLTRVQVALRHHLVNMDLRDALISGPNLVSQTREALSASEELAQLGVSVLGLSILSLKPTPETARALEASVREELLREADEAAYARRNAAVEQERAIRENELNTDIAVEKKKRKVREEKIEADRSVKQKQNLIKQEDMAAKITLESENKALTSLAAENRREKADAEAYAIAAVLKSMANTNPKVLQALASVGMDPSQLVAQGFRDLAESADKIGHLNISPDLLQTLMSKEA